jgi:hypothetical protein
MDPDTRFARIEELLRERGALQVAHPGGNLFDHVKRVARLLHSWKATRQLQLAGLSHAMYGTDGFATALLRLEERPLLQSVIGKEVEGLVYIYASCDRSKVYARLGDAPLDFRDRFTQTSFLLSEPEAAALVEMTVVNELDIAMVNPEFAGKHGVELLALFKTARRHLSISAWDACQIVLGEAAAYGTS